MVDPSKYSRAKNEDMGEISDDCKKCCFNYEEDNSDGLCCGYSYDDIIANELGGCHGKEYFIEIQELIW